MFGQHPISETIRALRAIGTNQVARFAPRLYVTLTGQTGRGGDKESAQAIAAYFRQCLDDYFEKLGIRPEAAHEFLSGKHVLEYGPGDVPAVALLFVAYGAESVTCVDRFPLVRQSPVNRDVMLSLLEGLGERERARACECFKVAGDVTSGLNPARIRYVVRPSGLSGQRSVASIVVSRAVLEHVDDLPATFLDMRRALTDDGIALHIVDLGSHGLHRTNPLDFLTSPDWLWHLMFSAKGVPNRLRPNAYRTAAAAAGLEIVDITPTRLVADEAVLEVRPYLAAPFRDLEDADLSWLGFWIKLRPVRGA